jgi:hypothetical protein
MSARSRAARTAKTRAAGDGVRITLGPGVRKELWLGLAALVLVGLAGLAAARLLRGAPGPETLAAPAAARERSEDPPPRGVQPAGAKLRALAHPRRIAAARAPAEAAPEPEPARPPGGDPKPADRGPPTHEEPPFSLGPRGSGIAVFPKPGTDPVKVGIVVPEDFELPEGFVRHHQVTDDGVDLPAILMFHPDYEWLDEHGRPLQIPADGVVPPELAPPDLEIRMLEVPGAPAEAAP